MSKLDDLDFTKFEDLIKAFKWLEEMPSPIRDYVNTNYSNKKEKNKSDKVCYSVDGIAAIGNIYYASKQICYQKPDGSEYVIAVFIKHSDRYDLKFIGKRPLSKNINWGDFKKLVKIGYKNLDGEDR